MIKIVQTNEHERIDKYLVNELEINRNQIIKLIEENKILVNGQEIKKNYKVKLDDKIEVPDDFQMEEDMDIVPENIEIDIVFENDDYVIVNKESGMVVHPAPGHYTGTLVNAILYHFHKLSSLDKTRPGIVHRIDKDTSGLLVVAKNNKTHNFLSDELKKRTLKRKYYALVNGIIKENAGRIEAPIGRDLKDRKKMAVTHINSKDATTHFKVITRFYTSNLTLIECELETGRTHQIRAHMKYIEKPIYNDPIYSTAKDDFGQYLHAIELQVPEINSKEVKTFKCELPHEFKTKLKKLEENEEIKGV